MRSYAHRGRLKGISINPLVQCNLYLRPSVSIVIVYTNYRRFLMQEEGYPAIFYVMLILGIIGVLGFLATAAGAAGGM
jgi:hypothetical protein